MIDNECRPSSGSAAAEPSDSSRADDKAIRAVKTQDQIAAAGRRPPLHGTASMSFY